MHKVSFSIQLKIEGKKWKFLRKMTHGTICRENLNGIELSITKILIFDNAEYVDDGY